MRHFSESPWTKLSHDHDSRFVIGCTLLQAFHFWSEMNSPLTMTTASPCGQSTLLQPDSTHEWLVQKYCLIDISISMNTHHFSRGIMILHENNSGFKSIKYLTLFFKLVQQKSVKLLLKVSNWENLKIRLRKFLVDTWINHEINFNVLLED